MRKFITLVLTISIALFCIGAASADATDIKMLGAFPNEPTGTMDVYFQATDASGAFVPADASKLSFRVDNSITLDTITGVTGAEGISYIFVVDCSCTYKQAKSESVSAALTAVVNGMRAQDNAFFITMSNKAMDSKGYMSSDQAREYVNNSVSFMEKTQAYIADIQAPLWDGIDAAAMQAAQNNNSAKPIKVILIFTDAMDTGTGKTIDQVMSTMGNCINTRVFSFVSIGDRESTDQRIADNCAATRSGLQRIKNQNGGNYYSVDSTQSGEQYGGQCTKEIQNIQCATVDIVALYEGGDQEYAVDLIYDSDEKPLSDSAMVRINRAAIPSPTPEPITRNPDVKFTWEELAERPSDLARIQFVLAEYYYLEAASGEVDTETKQAIYKFCEVNGCQATNEGISIEAWNAINSGAAMKKETATPVPEATRNPEIIFSLTDGFDNDPTVVASIQDALTDLNYLSQDENDAEYGAAGQATMRALNRFCKDNGRDPSQGLKKADYDFLLSGNAPKLTPEPVIEITPTPAPTMIPGLKLELNYPENDMGTVIKVQQALERLGYLTGKNNYTPGTYDAVTHAAVIAFCEKNGISDSEYGLTIKAYNQLTGPDAVPAIEITPEPTAAPTAHPFEPDMEDPGIEEYQNRLNELGYYEDRQFKLGVFDDATQAAQDRFCEVMNIEPQTGASVDLQRTVMSESAKQNEERPMLDRIRIKLTSDVEIIGFTMPMYALVGGIAVLSILAIVIIVKLIKSSKKKEKKGDSPYSSYSSYGTGTGSAGTASAQPVEYGSNEETVDMAENGADLPTTVDGNTQNITLRIDYNGSSIDKAYELSEGLPLVIGRGTDADIPTNKDDMRVSRKHGQFCYRDGEVYYRDMSRTGTIVNGQMIHETEVAIQNGAMIHISSHTIKVQM